MVNDPLLGHFCDKSTKFVDKWGKRFPYILMGAIPYSFIIIFLFLSPSANAVGQFGVFIWLLLFLFLFDGLFSLFDVNRIALFPTKFRDDKERKKGGFYMAIFTTIGILLGVVVPVLIIEILGETPIGWFLQAAVIAIIAFFVTLLMIPGVREPPELRNKLVIKAEKQTEPFIDGLKLTLKDKNFIGYVGLQVMYSATMGIMIAGIPWFVKYILDQSKIAELILIGYILGVFVTAPIWYKLSFKIGIRNVLLISAIILASMGLPLLFIPSGTIGLIFAFIVIFIAGLVDGGVESMMDPIFASIIDKASLERRKRIEGTYRGISIFFIRLGIFIRTFMLWLITVLFGFDPKIDNPPESSLIGLRLYMSVIPMLLMFIGIVLFVLFYKITQKQLEQNIEKLEELNI